MPISRNLHKECGKVSIKARSTPALLSFKDQTTKYTNVKWSIAEESSESKHMTPRKKFACSLINNFVNKLVKFTKLVNDLQKGRIGQQTLSY